MDKWGVGNHQNSGLNATPLEDQPQAADSPHTAMHSALRASIPLDSHTCGEIVNNLRKQKVVEDQITQVKKKIV